MLKNLKNILVEQGDNIALLIASITATILLTLNILPEKFASTIILSVLCLLSFHHLRRTMRIERMSKQIDGVASKIDNTREMMISFYSTKNSMEEIGVSEILMKRNAIPIIEMHDEAKSASNVFILSRYFKAFANNSAQTTIISCLKNGGEVRILLYAPQGSHLNVSIEPDITPEEALVQISQTIRRLRKFKQQLPKALQIRFQYKIVQDYIIYSSLVGTSNKIYATVYLNNLRGEECPTIICIPTNFPEKSMYSKFYNEFNSLWVLSKEDSTVL